MNILTPGILSNDTDEEGDDLNATLLDGPDHGVIQINSDGSFEYIHDDSETLLDSVRYLVSDNDVACSDTATVFITINPVPDCPIPLDDIYYVTEGESITIDSCITTVTDPGTGYENWAPGEPNNSGNAAYILSYDDKPDFDGKWDDNNSSLSIPHLLEVDKLITSLSGYTYLGQFDGHSYFKSNLAFEWDDAKLQAETAGGYLAIIKTKEENDTIRGMISDNMHIGLYQDPNDKYFEEPLGAWKWLDGSDMTYDLWQPGQPDNALEDVIV